MQLSLTYPTVIKLEQFSKLNIEKCFHVLFLCYQIINYSAMAKSKSNTSKSISLKKEINQQITAQLSTLLPALKEILGKRKFETRIKKASKLLSEGIKEKTPKKTKEVKKKANKNKMDGPGQEMAEINILKE